MKDVKEVFTDINQIVRNTEDREPLIYRYAVMGLFEFMLISTVFFVLLFTPVAMSKRFAIVGIIALTFICFHTICRLYKRKFLLGSKFKRMAKSLRSVIQNYNQCTSLLPCSGILMCNPQYVLEASRNQVKCLATYCEFKPTDDMINNLNQFITSAKTLNKTFATVVNEIPYCTKAFAFWEFCCKIGLGCKKQEYASVYPCYTFRYLHPDTALSKEYTIVLTPDIATQLIQYLQENKPVV